MKLTALGVWGGYPTRDAGTTSYLLQSEEGFNLLLDAGSRAVTELEHELSPNDLDAIILSHYHEDHIADLGALRQYRQLQTVKPEMLPIYGHQENEYEFSKLSLENVSEGIAYDVENGTSVGPFDIQFLKTVHPVICYAMRIVERATGQVLIYTGDTGYFAELVDFSKDADILLADVYFFKDKAKMPNHLSSVEAGEIAAQANVKKLILTHLPQVGDLQVLREEAQEAAGNIPVDLAQPHMKWTV
ncbi:MULTISPECIES: MBL fold metallo-hydrolase [Lactococcus]|uniref:MBL fold metallo-hydrolase n=1 Tax=Lactococcus petauri TaxID=1940789 RepID=A0A252CA73_9LACT|nr:MULTISPECIES: MBL fold metallo-hydrolase [Lactococcus]MCH1713474.1 MBL fold metallo-hydrolase [Lactococcus petauri]MDT2526815.1 MBL fold metallo-hydrolase [Lactococcus petauri]MDT2541360.1 MBL fold metallo-hydrolase [Lactococcus petauri]MDT2558153.1 MBL fold metallo-hydrolase [Lactococcus petauri]MDT2560283.1 MBL fold metallo-hydrolase [Lactococcus petauri]